jgi:hypothetical protein
MTNSNSNNDKSLLMEQIRIDAVKYDLYFKFEQEYNKIVNAYHTAFAEAQSDPDKSLNWADTYRFYFEKMNTALSNWKEYGYKNELDTALTRLEQQMNNYRCYPVKMRSLVPTRTPVSSSAA